MRAVREMIGGISLAILAAVTVIGGLWVAVSEGGQGLAQATAVVAATVTAGPVRPSATAGQPASPTPLQAATGLASLAPTLRPTVTLNPSQAATGTLPPTRTPTASPTPTPTSSATQTSPPPPTITPRVSAVSPAPCIPPPAWVKYIVAPGDTLFQLSLRFGVSPHQLQTANCLADADIKFGQTLFVPFVASATSPAISTSTPTATPVSQPLAINGITLVSVQVDASRPNGAIATLFINFSGGAAPYTIYNDDAPQTGNPFPVLTDCGGALLHTLRVLSADGQSVDYPYSYAPVNCP